MLGEMMGVQGLGGPSKKINSSNPVNALPHLKGTFAGKVWTFAHNNPKMMRKLRFIPLISTLVAPIFMYVFIKAKSGVESDRSSVFDRINQSYKLNQASNIAALIPIIGNVVAFILQRKLSQ